MTIAPFTKRILKVFADATPEEIQTGIDWYAVANREAQALADDHGMPLHVVVGVIAALSPNNRWERNLIDAASMLQAWKDGASVENVTVCTYKPMRAKAWLILETHKVCDGGADVETVLDILNGQKIVAFAECILGRDACCIDGHALNIARGKREALTSDKTHIGKRLFRDLQRAYSNAGKLRGYTAFEMQAITWTVWRRQHGIA